MQQICKVISTKSSKIAIRENLDPRKFSAIRYSPGNKRVIEVSALPHKPMGMQMYNTVGSHSSELQISDLSELPK